VVGITQGFSRVTPTTMAYSAAHQRLYLGYSTGAIRYIDVTAGTPVETAFASFPTAVNTMASAGNFLLAFTTASNLINSSGVTVSQGGGYYSGYTREFTWDPVNSRLYDCCGTNLRYDVLNTTTGAVTSSFEAPYYGFPLVPPVRVSANGQYILLGSGDIYSQSGLTWAGSLGAPIADARWMANGTVVTLAATGNQTTLRRLGASNLATLELRTFSGLPLRVLGSDATMVVVLFENNTVKFQSYVPDDDSDDDGVDNTQDAFPLDVAASVDTEHDEACLRWQLVPTVDESDDALLGGYCRPRGPDGAASG